MAGSGCDEPLLRYTRTPHRHGFVDQEATRVGTLLERHVMRSAQAAELLPRLEARVDKWLQAAALVRCAACGLLAALMPSTFPQSIQGAWRSRVARRLMNVARQEMQRRREIQMCVLIVMCASMAQPSAYMLHDQATRCCRMLSSGVERVRGPAHRVRKA